LGSHQLDAASIFIAAVHGGRKQHPLGVAAISNRPIFEHDREADDHVCCMFEFPAPGYDPKGRDAQRKKIGVQYASINGNGFGGYGEIVFGTKGTLILEREKEALLYRDDGASKVTAEKSSGATMDTPSRSSTGPGASAAIPRSPTPRSGPSAIPRWPWATR
jgi:hypothetical protein